VKRLCQLLEDVVREIARRSWKSASTLIGQHHFTFIIQSNMFCSYENRIHDPYGRRD
jgi:hypothetical protein